jgi:hypothetical protein
VTAARIQRGTLEVVQVGDFWEVRLNIGGCLVELLITTETRSDAEIFVADLCSAAL